MKRKLTRVVTPKAHQGFLGPGHIAKALIDTPFEASDPFIVLMDDKIEVPPGDPVGSPHPHAGFETVTLILEGKFSGGEHESKGGDFELMTAGSGIVHTESLHPGTKAHILQMWLTLPKKDRWTEPRLQILPAAHVPRSTGEGKAISVYSGSFAGLTSPVRHYVPVIVADIGLAAGVSISEQLPASFNTFMYLLEGSVEVGEEGKGLHEGQVGWLDRLNDEAGSELLLKAGGDGARLILYAGLPQHDEIVSHGPFIGDTREDISRVFKTYQQGKMKHISKVPEEQLLVW
jgi:redox-sensitive bicupin YhaK (pirin superfamily)